MAKQFALQLIDHKHGDEIISLRARDGYINATAMCRAAGKEWPRYRSLQPTIKFFALLAEDTGIDENRLAISNLGFAGEDRKNQGTWVHPQIAIDLAQWLSPEFKVQVTKWVMEWMGGMGSPMATRPASFDFMKRFQLNINRTSHGYFSIISELYIRINGELENMGYVLPEHGKDGKLMRPDISVGQTFPKWLESNYPGLVKKRIKYSHLLPNETEVDAWQYHNSVWPQFQEFMATEWLLKRAENYFKERDSAALPFLEKYIAALPSPEEYPSLPNKD